MRTLLLALILLVTLPAQAQPASPDSPLQAAVEAAVDGFEGVVGVYVEHLPSGRSAALRPDELFPTASMVKVPILVATFQRIDDGDLDYGADLVFRDSLRYSEYDLFGDLRDGAEVPLHQAVELMLSASDNTASLWLQRLAGGGAAINAWLDEHGFEATRVNSRTPGREDAREVYGWGQTTPREMATLMRRIVEGQAVSPAADEEMHRLLTRTFYDDEAISALPPSVQAASKQGAVMESRSEVVYVHAPSGPYVFCVVTKEQADLRYEPDNAGYELLRALSRLFWDTFEPDHAWTPAENAGRYRF
ncbi:MAG: serine hydrolase [Bacteroidota bacterium]